MHFSYVLMWGLGMFTALFIQPAQRDWSLAYLLAHFIMTVILLTPFVLLSWYAASWLTRKNITDEEGLVWIEAGEKIYLEDLNQKNGDSTE